MLLLGGEAQLAGCLREQEGFNWCETKVSSDNAQSIIMNTVNEESMDAATPSWYILLSSQVDQRQGSCVQSLGTSTPP